MEIHDIKLYHFPLTRSTRVRWMLEEIGLEYAIIIVDIFAGETYTEVCNVSSLH